MAKQQLTVGEVAARSGFAASALRYYERAGLLHPTRTAGNQRRYDRSVLRVLAFVAAARHPLGFGWLGGRVLVVGHGRPLWLRGGGDAVVPAACDRVGGSLSRS